MRCSPRWRPSGPPLIHPASAGRRFARRGLGVDAVAPDCFDNFNAGVVESYNPGVELIFADYFEDPAP